LKKISNCFFYLSAEGFDPTNLLDEFTSKPTNEFENPTKSVKSGTLGSPGQNQKKLSLKIFNNFLLQSTVQVFPYKSNDIVKINREQ